MLFLLLLTLQELCACQAFFHQVLLPSLQSYELDVDVLDIVRNTINDERVEISVLNSFEPLPISPYDESNFGYQILKRTIHSVFSGVPVVPGVCIGNTDSRHFVNLTDSIYRFSPFLLKPEDLGRIHGLNERISVESLKQLVQFYYQLIQNADSDEAPTAYQANYEL